MNWLDIMLLIFMVPSVLAGWKFGLIRSLFGLIALIVGIVLASRFYSPLADRHIRSRLSAERIYSS